MGAFLYGTRRKMSMIRNRQKNWLGLVFRGISVMKIALEGRMVGKKTVGRPRVMLFDWMFDERNNWTCQHVENLA